MSQKTNSKLLYILVPGGIALPIIASAALAIHYVGYPGAPNLVVIYALLPPGLLLAALGQRRMAGTWEGVPEVLHIRLAWAALVYLVWVLKYAAVGRPIHLYPAGHNGVDQWGLSSVETDDAVYGARVESGGAGSLPVRRTTIRKRMRAKLRQIKQELHTRMHDPVPQTGEWLKSVVQGYFNYYAVPGNLKSLAVFRDRLLGLWWRALRRRSQPHRLSWTRTLTLGKRWLPQPRVLHPYPADRFAASHPR